MKRITSNLADLIREAHPHCLAMLGATTPNFSVVAVPLKNKKQKPQ